MFVYSALKYFAGGDEERKPREGKLEKYDEFGNVVGAEEVDRSTEELFNSACDFLQTVTDRVGQEDLLFFYAHYKQAMNGPAAPDQRPNIFEQAARRKYDAWRALKEMSRSDAMFAYVEKLVALDLGWNAHAQKTAEKPQGGIGSGFGVKPSRPMRKKSESGSSELQSLEGRWFHAVRSSHIEALSEMLGDHPELISLHEDETLLTALHWAADTGNVAVCNFLLEHGALIDDVEVDGQTPLHYAVVCANKEVVEMLLERGADPHLTDKDGLSALDMAEEDDICELIEASIRGQAE
uniref:Acyl-CoA-binding domain-containing protein 6 n=1 Tax=Steinernema glaseri TaxID=37863 RepID=A0A1I8ACX2_9BILA